MHHQADIGKIDHHEVAEPKLTGSHALGLDFVTVQEHRLHGTARDAKPEACSRQQCPAGFGADLAACRSHFGKLRHGKSIILKVAPNPVKASWTKLVQNETWAARRAWLSSRAPGIGVVLRVEGLSPEALEAHGLGQERHVSAS